MLIDLIQKVRRHLNVHYLIRCKRTLSKALDFSYRGDLYQVENSGKGYRYRHTKIDIYEHEDRQ